MVGAGAAVSFAGAICAPAATVGGDEGREVPGGGAGSSWCGAGVSGASRRWQRTLLDRLGLGCRWGDWRRGEPRTSNPGPHLSFYSAVRRGPTNHVGLGASDQDARTRPKGRWA
jgi:hypothetical protein